jgi:hypothetical protein
VQARACRSGKIELHIATTATASSLASAATVSLAGRAAEGMVGRAAMDVDPYEMAFHWVPGAPSHRPEHVTVMGLGRMMFVRRSGSLRPSLCSPSNWMRR